MGSTKRSRRRWYTGVTALRPAAVAAACLAVAVLVGGCGQVVREPAQQVTRELAEVAEHRVVTEAAERTAREATERKAQERTAREATEVAAREQAARDAGLPLGRGHTGDHTPDDLREKLVMDEVMSNPGVGTRQPFDMGDPRWPGPEGWVKMRHVHNGVVIHYVFNTRTGAYDDLKFK